jgi:hypothetical protein
MLVFGCRQLRAVLAEDADHYNGHRPHRALGQAPPLGPAEPPVILPAGGVVRLDSYRQRWAAIRLCSQLRSPSPRSC